MKTKTNTNTIKIVSKWLQGEAQGSGGIFALVIIVGMICLTVAWK